MYGVFSIILFSSLALTNSVTWQVNSNYKIDYEISGSKLNLVFTLLNGKTGWMGLCFNEFMYPSDCIVCQYNNNRGECFDSYNPGVTGSSYYPAPIIDTYSSTTGTALTVLGNHGVDNLQNIVGTKANNQIIISVSRNLATGDRYDFEIVPGNQIKMVASQQDSVLWNSAGGSTQTKHTYHGSTVWKTFGIRVLINTAILAVLILLS